MSVPRHADPSITIENIATLRPYLKVLGYTALHASQDVSCQPRVPPDAAAGITSARKDVNNWGSTPGTCVWVVVVIGGGWR